MDCLKMIDDSKTTEQKLYRDVFSFLSFEKVTFNDLQLKPYRTDDFITKLFYESSRFSAFSYQWVMRARVIHNQKDPAHSSERSLQYQLVSKSKLTSPITLHFMALKGPYGDMKLTPAIYKFDFTNEAVESEHQDLPIIDSVECNRLLAAKTINLRLIIFQVPS